jgi:type I restriction enzyme S subunit
MREDIKRRIEQIRRGEVPEGYKKSLDVPIPEDWKVKRLGEILKIKYGKDQKDVEKKDGMYPILATGGVIGRTDRYLYDKPSVLIGRKGTIDRPMYIETPFWTVDTLFYSIVRDNNSVRFVHYLISSINWKKYSEATTLPSLSSSVIEGIKAAIPESDEQTKIAEILSTCDRVIELKKKLIEEKKKVKKWFMQTLLTGMIRVKDIENATPYEELKKRIEQIRSGQVPEGYRKTELGIISHDWEITGLEKICKLIIDKRGKTPKKDSSDGDIPGLSAHNVKMGKIDFTFPTTYYSEDVFNRWMKSEKIEREDIIMTTEAPLGNIALVEEARKYILGQRVVALRLKDSVNSTFGKHLLMSNVFQRKLQELATGTTAKGLSKRNLKYLKIYIPDTETQEAVSSILSSADKEIDLLNKDLEQWEIKKKSLMQLLLTGIVRVSTEN